ncbi:sterol desaturase family protein [Asticcacaulis solisilvae]|uniref:sterol desaturase family protein n=1 Tax=Asticcacaulis solisilvae TaxID=1217274 RepID=UPI003FD87801
MRKAHRPVIWAMAALVFGAYLWGLGSLWAWVAPSIPAEFSIHVAGRTVTAHDIPQKIHDSLLLLLGILPFAFFVEAVAVGWGKSSVRRILFDRNDSIRMDLAYLFAGQTPLVPVLGKVLTFGLSAAVGVWIHDRLVYAFGGEFGLSLLPAFAQVFVCFWIYTFFDYWTHRLDHTYFFWPLHRYHHSTRDFCVITSLRSHPAAFTGTFIINVPMAIMGAPVPAMITVNLIVMTIGLFIHSGIDSNWGWFGRWVIQSPNHHRLHHILDYKSNGVGHFAIAPIWDHLFGTWKGEADQTLPIGVDTPYRHGYLFFIDLFRDYYDFVRTYALVFVGKKRID